MCVFVLPRNEDDIVNVYNTKLELATCRLQEVLPSFSMAKHFGPTSIQCRNKIAEKVGSFPWTPKPYSPHFGSTLVPDTWWTEWKMAFPLPPSCCNIPDPYKSIVETWGNRFVGGRIEVCRKSPKSTLLLAQVEEMPSTHTSILLAIFDYYNVDCFIFHLIFFPYSPTAKEGSFAVAENTLSADNSVFNSWHLQLKRSLVI